MYYMRLSFLAIEVSNINHQSCKIGVTQRSPSLELDGGYCRVLHSKKEMRLVIQLC